METFTIALMLVGLWIVYLLVMAFVIRATRFFFHEDWFGWGIASIVFMAWATVGFVFFTWTCPLWYSA